MSNILVVDDNPSILKYIGDILEGAGYRVVKCGSGMEAVESIHTDSFDLVISDLAMPGMDGYQVIQEVRLIDPEIPIIIITGVGGVDEAVKAIKKGASDFMIKPFQPQEFRVKVERNLEYFGLKQEVEQLKKERGERKGTILIGESAPMRRLTATVRQIAQSNASIMIFGESGTGKELIAKTIHEESERRAKPFVPIDCSALSENIIESELFGHVRGAFTGAERTKKGLLEEANGGTIFLDEVGNLNWQVQSKLLRFLQEREIKPVGSSKVMKVNVRIISATNVNLRREIENGTFREDLFYRLSGIELNVPPLRERLEDIPFLVDHFIRKYSRDMGKKINFAEEEALELLRYHKWSGNVRELEHLIEYALVVEKKSIITANTISHILPDRGNGDSSFSSFEPSLNAAMRDFEKNHIERVIKLAKNNKARAARLLGISRSMLYDKMKKYGIEQY
ncbi:MAG TPA: sigma-54-dependent Fis family transcriptional regulator [Spirochaetes bacterium]|nr:sigma-54-dependent Fis family transcriptional regulator [Spirochaetota bacterium]